VLVPLNNPMHLAKEVATLQELSGGRFTLGVGMGWHRHEFEFIGVEFKGRGRRADEAIRLMRALWSGERDFEGQFWSFHDATSQPQPSPRPEIWVGGSSERAIRRALELGDVWHPSRGSDAEHIRRVKEQHPALRVIPRIASENVDAMLEAGAEGAVLSFAGEGAMRDFVRRFGSGHRVIVGSLPLTQISEFSGGRVYGKPQGTERRGSLCSLSRRRLKSSAVRMLLSRR
jgi:alkanesulfonate monooxygenase SsuD/methylene tetrahydromethanopterin reductase-like flavin-dependent oxidoreductase (luciferase family)